MRSRTKLQVSCWNRCESFELLFIFLTLRSNACASKSGRVSRFKSFTSTKAMSCFKECAALVPALFIVLRCGTGTLLGETFMFHGLGHLNVSKSMWSTGTKKESARAYEYLLVKEAFRRISRIWLLSFLPILDLVVCKRQIHYNFSFNCPSPYPNVPSRSIYKAVHDPAFLSLATPFYSLKSLLPWTGRQHWP